MNNYFNEELIEQYFPEAGELMLPPQLVWKFPNGKEDELEQACNSGDYFASLKKDGACYQFVKTENHSYLFGRTVSKTTNLLTEKLDNVPHIKHSLDCLPPKTILLTEIYYPHQTSKDVVSIMGCLPKKAIERQKDNPIHAYVHDIIYYDGVDLRQTGALDRYKILEAIWKLHGFSSFDYLELAQLIYDNILGEAIKAFENGEEGLVLRKKDGFYYPGKRPAHITIKIKEHDSVDLVCIGFCDPTKEYTGLEIETWPYWESDIEIKTGKQAGFSDIYMLHGKTTSDKCQYGKSGWYPVTKPYFYGWKTAIEVGAYNDKGEIVKIGTVSSGLTDEDKQGIAEHPENYLNRVVTLDCMSVDRKNFTLRHPALRCWREDKDPKDCIISEVFA